MKTKRNIVTIFYYIDKFQTIPSKHFVSAIRAWTRSGSVSYRFSSGRESTTSIYPSPPILITPLLLDSGISTIPACLTECVFRLDKAY